MWFRWVNHSMTASCGVSQSVGKQKSSFFFSFSLDPRNTEQKSTKIQKPSKKFTVVITETTLGRLGLFFKLEVTFCQALKWN